VKWGPWTKDVSCKATGAGKAVELSWTVEFTTVNCPDGLTNAGTILQFRFDVTYDIDKEGYTARSVNSSLTIAQTRKKVDDKALQATADEHREKMIPPIPPTYRRESQSYRLDPAKTTITATVRDVQMPGNLPPVRVVDGSIEHNWQSQELFRWSGTISATYDIARREGSPGDAIAPFLDLVKDRVDEGRGMKIPPEAAAAPGPGAAVAGAVLRAGDPVAIYLRGASAGEPNVLGRLQVRLGVQYMAGPTNFAEILRSGGLWKPTEPHVDPEGHWKKWIVDSVGRVRARALAALVHPERDSLVDACVPGATPALPNQSQNLDPSKAVAAKGFAAAIAAAFPPPSAGNSWIEYRNFVTTHTDMGRILGRTLPSLPLVEPKSPGGTWNTLTGLPSLAAQSLPFRPVGNLLSGQKSAGGGTVFHQRTRPVFYVTMTGEALRGRFQIPVAELLEVDGAKPVLVGQPWFTTGTVAHTQVPIVYAGGS
jgi:hypothetical protein